MTVYEIAQLLPGIDEVRDRSKALAMLDAIMAPDWTDRYFSFATTWAPGATLASMNNGSGDSYSIVFTEAGAFARGFDHESPMSPWGNVDHELWPGLVDAVPVAFARQVAEPAFCDEDGTLEATCCLWRLVGDDRWQTGSIEFPDGRTDPDGANRLFEVLTAPSAHGYREFAEDYYETAVDLDCIEHVYGLRPLTELVVRALNPDLTLSNLARDIADIGYPPETTGR